jgi:two-component system chemotaxis response regulator CheY
VAKILVVDDEPALALLVAECLKTGGHEAVVCHDSSLALALALKENPALAIIDYQMPGKTGVQLLSDLRGRPETKLLPVLFLSGTETVRYAGQVPPEPRVRFLRKPAERQVLLVSVAEMLDPDSWTHAS